MAVPCPAWLSVVLGVPGSNRGGLHEATACAWGKRTGWAGWSAGLRTPLGCRPRPEARQALGLQAGRKRRGEVEGAEGP